ncbi:MULTISPECIES: hypothetical protein [unclassified Microcoleus]|uniref:hypothetical protein n=1 Tax=unclassified Microcoleus TaxID=2642155 RepID=UPI0025E535C5|nr:MULTISPECIES: hypothetical protein [unclassified Microcoleus]
MNSLILISPSKAWGFQPILSGKQDCRQDRPQRAKKIIGGKPVRFSGCDTGLRMVNLKR